MSRSDAHIVVYCDACGAEERVGLTALGRESYDMRNVANSLKCLGWTVRGDRDFCCDECAETAE